MQKAFLAKYRAENQQAVVLDVPLLIETGWYKMADGVWLVVESSAKIERAILRSGMSEEEVTARIEAQMSLAEKKQYADVIIDNSG